MSKAKITMIVEHDGEYCGIKCKFLEVKYFSVSSRCTLFKKPLENMIDKSNNFLHVTGCKRCDECIAGAVPADENEGDI